MDLNASLAKLQQDNFEIRWPIGLGSTGYNVFGVLDINKETNLHPYQNITYFLYNEATERAIVIDPGIIDKSGKERGSLVRRTLGIKPICGIITHSHVDHWIGTEAYKDIQFYATKRCIDVVGQTDDVPFGVRSMHPNDVDQRVWNYAKSLSLDGRLVEYNDAPTHLMGEFSIELLEIPGQTRDSLYALVQAENQKFLFAGDLFFDVGEDKPHLIVEPHYSTVGGVIAVQDALLVINAILDQPQNVSDEYKDQYPNIEMNLRKLANPDMIFLGHNMFFAKGGENQEDLRELASVLQDVLSYKEIKPQHKARIL